ncbi:MAG: TolC family protein [Endomicrobium sp.]|uniref:TolC family protein n=1 Tax=Candidatus Endomicrobiellum pyrsonymphae TaxID=1408203 RepID=UPI00357ADCFD|nr:TolC family protein [Endomicrobium sp.]
MKKIVMILLSMMFLCSYGYAEKINRALVDEQTLKNNPSIVVAKLNLDNAKRAYYGSFGSFFPSLTLFGTFSDAKFEKRERSYGLETSLSLFSGFKTYNDVKEKAALVKVAQANYDRAVSDAMCTARAEYVNLMWAYETVELSVQIRERRIKNKDLIKFKYNSGDVDISSLKIEEANVAKADHNLRRAQRYIETTSAALLKAIGRNDDAVILETDEKIISLEQALSKPDYNSLVATIPEFLIAKYKQDASKAHNAMVKKCWLPSVDIVGDMMRSNKWSPDTEGWVAKINVSFPFFDGGKNYNNVKTASNNLKIASETLKDTINGLKVEAVKRYNDLIDAQEALETETYHLSALKLQAEVSSKKYLNGFLTYHDWHTMEDNYTNFQIELLDHRKKVEQSRGNWDNFLGKGFTNDKEENK